MAWDNKDNNNDPWGKKKSDMPPNIDEVLKNLQKKLSKYFGGNSGNSNKNKGNGGIAIASFGLIFIALLILWIISGIFIVGPAEEAVITRFGKYKNTVGPGLNWIPRFVDRVYVVDVENVADYSYSSSMLTQDENIVLVEVAVQYRIGNPKEYLFNVDSPVESLQQATASALRHVVGHTELSDILTTGREAVREKVRKQLNQILKRYVTGLVLLDVVMQPATPPEEVKEAFDDAIKAQEDEQRYKHQAEAYERGVVPVAKGKAKRILEAAEAYKQQRILKARGDVARFNAILPEYRSAPNVTRKRLYIDTMELVLSNTSKLVLDTKQGNNLMYLPIDKIINNASDDSDAPRDTSEISDNTDSKSSVVNSELNRYSLRSRDSSKRRSSRRSY